MAKQVTYRVSLTIKKGLSDKLKARAKLNNRSMVAEIRQILETVTNMKKQGVGDEQ